MSSRRTGAGAQSTYAAAEAWVNCALRDDGSLFTPGEAIWTRQLLGELHSRFLNQPDESNRDFFVKLEEQLSNSPPEVLQLMGEVMYIHYLPLTNNAANKLQRIQQVLGWSRSPVQIPDGLAAGLQSKLINIGAGASNRPYQVGTLVESVEQWKDLGPVEQGRLLEDPWEFKNFLLTRQFNSKLLVNNQNTGAIQRELLLHVVFPDTFETIGANHKNQIANAPRFARFVAEGTTDIDRRIMQIRQGIEAERGGNFYFYDDDILLLWRDEAPNPWDEFIGSAKEYVSSGLLESNEVEYKAQIGQRLSAAREAVLAGTDDWPRLVKRGVSGNLINGIMQSRLGHWIDGEPEESLLAFQKIWAADDSAVSQRIREFCGILPRSAVSGSGTRMNAVSVLLMGLDAEQFPPFRVTVSNQAYERTGYARPEQGADEAELYECALNFLDRFIEEAAKRDLELRHRLDAQSVVWGIQQGIGQILDDDGDDDKGNSEIEPDPDLDALARELYVDEFFLERVSQLLEEKKQVIFQGPPGTGKTYVAQALAECLAGHKGRVMLVQFHPSYAYEDFVQGFRPRKDGDGFELRDGPLLRAAESAAVDKNYNHFLVIDEINRGNLAKVFGELYFLLEYRGRKIRLQYSDEDFSLPDNLYIIGTMNTADRSIALVDMALRRRFYFVEFHPDKEPVRGLLRRYLRGHSLEKMGWVADVVDRANEQLGDDRHAAVGPSHFMKPDLNDAMVERIWDHGVLPYIEERLFGRSDDRMVDFSLDKLRGLAPQHESVEDGDSGNETAENGGDGA